jgi:oligosaccharide repeat unit polymerase
MRALAWNGLGRLERGVIAAGAVAVVAMAIVVWISGAPVAWLMLGYSGVVAVGALVIQLWHQRFFEPLTVIAAFVLISFVFRALQLFIEAEDLLSFYFTTDPFDEYLRLETSETAQFVTERLKGPLAPALTRGIGVVAIFVTLVVIGYVVPWGPKLGRRLQRIGQSTPAPTNANLLVAACLAIGAVGQAIVMVKVGGPVAALEDSVQHTVFRAGLEEHFLIGFGLIGLLVWAAYSPPTSGRARVAFTLATLELVAFFAIATSRTRVVLVLGIVAIVIHYLWRRWQPREIAIGVVGLVVFASAMLGVRQATLTNSTHDALEAAPTYVTDPRGILNDLNEFDYLFEATAVIGSGDKYNSTAPFQYGKGLWQGVHPFVPGFIDADRPESRDQEFRRIIWGETQGEGRPYTVIGDFWNDFGFAGVVVGSFILGLFSRAMLGLVAPQASGPGREYRAIIYAMGLMLLYVGVSTTYSLTVGFLIIFGIPLLLTMHVMRPLSERLGRRLALRAPRSEKAPVP